MKYYLGLTIGPIVKTLLSASKTRHLWAASYSFSYLMKEIAKAFDEQHPGRVWLKPALGDAARQAFLPAVDRTNIDLKNTGAGIFPDHLIMESLKEEDLVDLQRIAMEVIDDYANAVAKRIKKGEQEVRDYCRRYFQIHIVRKQISKNQNPILAVSNLLHTVERVQQFAPEKRDFLDDLFNWVNHSFLTEDAFGQSHSFDSIPEIAFRTHLESPRSLEDGTTCWSYYSEKKAEIKDGNGDVDDDQSLIWVKDFIQRYNSENRDDPIPFLTGHKYIAIVHADGDGIGAMLNSLPESSLPDFSALLTEFAAKAAKMVEEFRGMPVYFGGDDALFFAPVVMGDRTIFDLLQNMDRAFQAKFDGLPGVQTKPTLSFGLSITYIKFPLYEALEQSRELLLKVAKTGLCTDIPKKGGGAGFEVLKNNIAFRVLRHSGSAFSGMIHLNDKSPYSTLASFRKLFELNTGEQPEALRSIIYRIPENEGMLTVIGKDQEKLTNFLQNSFDEPIHADKDKFFGTVADLIRHVFEHRHRYPVDADPEAYDNSARMAYNILKTVAFLTSEEE